ncbi:MAG: YdcF family protein [Propionibacteriaceae bacterium]|nr:YdcF family protein [Propionibacteriaceae bacterium]
MGRIIAKIVRRLVVTLVVLAVVAIGGPWASVHLLTHGRVYGQASQAPVRKVALVLGAAVWPSGPSPYLQGRLDVAADLYRHGKVSVIIVSGTLDGSYDEPDAMRAALVKAGVPYARIVPDYAGFDTYSSCLRARDVFGVKALTVVSQAYHVPRAVATCRLVGVDAIGVGDDSQTHDARWWQYQVRELGSNMKMVWDVVRHRRLSDMAPSSAVTEALATAG